MIRTEESKRLWFLAEASGDFETLDRIEKEWFAQAAPEPIIDSPGDEQYIWQGEDSYEVASDVDWDRDYWDEWATEDLSWKNEDEAGLDEYEERKRQRIAEANEY